MKGKHSRAAMLIWIWIVIFSLASLAGAELGFLEREAFYQNGGIELAALILIPEGNAPSSRRGIPAFDKLGIEADYTPITLFV